HLNEINLDNYLPVASKKKSAKKRSTAKSTVAKASAEAIVLPAQLLKRLNIDGQLAIKSLTMSKVNLTNLQLKTTAKNGILQAPITADVYQGKFDANIAINAQGKQPKLTIAKGFQGVQLQPLMQQYLKSSNIKLVGLANLNANLTTVGETMPQLTKNLNGTIKFSVNNGEIKGLSISNQFANVQKIITKAILPQTNDNQKNTPFTKLSGSFVIKQGVARNNDLVLTSPALQVNGGGYIDLNRQYIDYLIRAKTKLKLPKNLLQVQNYFRNGIPIRVSGNLDNIKIYPDTQAIMKAIAQRYMPKNVGEQIQKQFDGNIGQQLQKQLNGKAGEQLKKALDGFFK
ncbi:MAG: AsmA family protein, partial [Pseudomonadota bacterium]